MSRMIVVLGTFLLAAGFAITGLVVMVVGDEPVPCAYVVRERAGQLVVGYRSCPGEAIATLTVTERTVSPAVTVWEVSRSGDERTTGLTLGPVPAGFDEVHEFARSAQNHTLPFTESQAPVRVDEYGRESRDGPVSA